MYFNLKWILIFKYILFQQLIIVIPTVIITTLTKIYFNNN